MPFFKGCFSTRRYDLSGVSAGTELARKVEAARSARNTAGGIVSGSPDMPLNWGAIKPGSLVLATTGGGDESWFKALVVEENDDELPVLGTDERERRARHAG